MSRTNILLAALLGFSATVALGAAAIPAVLVQAAPGLWEVGKSADGHGAERVCIHNLGALAQWEHRGMACTRTTLSDTGSKAVIEYRCADGGFGRSDLTLLTPRTLRVSTQGIAKSYPFSYTLHARRVGDCPPR